MRVRPADINASVAPPENVATPVDDDVALFAAAVVVAIVAVL